MTGVPRPADTAILGCTWGIVWYLFANYNNGYIAVDFFCVFCFIWKWNGILVYIVVVDKMASPIPSTPRKVSFKTIENLHTICICCCQDNRKEKGRRLANTFKDFIIKLDKDYKYVFQTGAPVNLFIWKTCVSRLDKISSSRRKMEEMKAEIDAQIDTFGEVTTVFNNRLMQSKRASVHSPFKAKKQPRMQIL